MAAPKAREPAVKHYCFTLHSNEKRGEHLAWPGFKGKDVGPLDWAERLAADVKYLVYQVEKASSTDKVRYDASSPNRHNPQLKYEVYLV